MKEDPLREVRELTASLADTRDSVILTREILVGLGKEIWEYSYRHTKDDWEAFQALSNTCMRLAKESPGTRGSVKALTFLYLPLDQIIHYASAKWADLAFPVVQVGHKYAAALMATYVPPEATVEIHPPFDAFLIEIPPDLVHVRPERATFLLSPKASRSSFEESGRGISLELRATH